MAFRASENGYQLNGNQNPIVTPLRTNSPPPGPPLPAPFTPSRQSSRAPPSPLVVPSRADTFSSYTASYSPASSASSKPPSSDDANTAPNNGAGNGIYASAANAPRPLPHPRKSSLADSISSISSSTTTPSALTFASMSSSASPLNFGGNQAIPSQQYQASITPLTTPASFNNPFSSSAESLITRQRGLPPAASSPAIVQPPPATGASLSSNGSGIAQSQPSQQSLSLGDPRQFMQSRDSRISLPDEASRYIQNMTDSPVTSPRTDAFSPKSKLSSSVFPPVADGASQSGRESEFLDMDEEGEEEDSDEESAAGDAGDTTLMADDTSMCTSSLVRERH